LRHRSRPTANRGKEHKTKIKTNRKKTIPTLKEAGICSEAQPLKRERQIHNLSLPEW